MKYFIAKLNFNDGKERVCNWDERGPIGAQSDYFYSTKGFPPFVQVFIPLSKHSKQEVIFKLEVETINILGDYYYANYKEDKY